MLARQIEVRIKDYADHPRVSVAVEEARSLHITVFGRVANQGVLTLSLGASLVQVLALVRIRFRYDDLLRSRGVAPDFRLRSGDGVIVE